MDKENTKTITRGKFIGSNYVEELEYYDFNLYPLHLIEPGYQLFVVPTDTINEACYIVRQSDFSLHCLSHAKYAKELVTSETFIKREEEEYQNSNGTTPRWKDYREMYEDQEVRYLIEIFYLLDINPNLHIDKGIQDKLLAKITTKNKSR